MINTTAIPIFADILAGLLVASALASPPAPGFGPKEWRANPEKHQIQVKREAADANQSGMIAVAEAVQPSAETIRQAAEAADRNDPLGLNRKKGELVPVGEKVWWYKEQQGVRIPCAITADAVAYYTELVINYGKQAFRNHNEPSSRLSYHAGVTFHKEFKVADKGFKDVHMVALKLTFDQIGTMGAGGMHFEKERTVVLDAAGKVLHVSGDGPTEVPVLEK